MKNEDKKSTEGKIKSEKEEQQPDSVAENNDAKKNETLEERAERENWTDVAESHLGIDE